MQTPRAGRARAAGLAALIGVATFLGADGAAQSHQPGILSGWASGAVVVPQQRVYAFDGDGHGVRVNGVQARVVVDGRHASTTILLKILNDGPRPTEAQLLLPLPAGAVVRGFRFEGLVDGPTARLLPREEARATYDAIVARVRDPALLEMTGRAALQSSVFPVEAGGGQAVQVTWDQLLTERDGRLDYVLGRSELVGSAAVPWRIAVELRGSASVGTAWSPTHELNRARLAGDRLLVTTRDEDVGQPGPFQLTWTVARPGTLSATLLGHPHGDPARGGGHLALLAGVPSALPDGTLPREVTLVLDRSGSMRGEKWAQSLEAARQVLAGLRPGEAVNIIDYADDVARFAPAPVGVDAALQDALQRYLDGLAVGGGTDLHGALLAAVEPPPSTTHLPVVLFLTDGRPTVGVTDEGRLRDAIADANTGARRLFTFGVGSDVNAPLLDALAAGSRALSTYVLPGQDVEVAVGVVARRLHGPLVAEPVLEVFDAAGRPAPHALRERQPAALPDLYADDQLLVLGRYVDATPLRLRLSGRTAAGAWSAEWAFDPADARAEHAYVTRLWAARRIAALVDEVRQSAPDGKPPADGRLDELVQEVVALSTEHGILTEYTAFLATEGSVMGDDSVLRKRVRLMLNKRGRQTRTGQGAVSQAVNLARLAAAGHVDRRHRHLVDQGGGLAAVEIEGVRHVHDLTFFRAADERWVDARLVQRLRDGLAGLAARSAQAAGAPDAELAAAAGEAFTQDEMLAVTVVEFGSPEHTALARSLESQGRLGVLALGGQVLLLVDDHPVRLRPPSAAQDP